jgi:hypothetical protein
MLRHRLTLLVTVAILIGLMAAPAAADKPTESFYAIDFTDEWNPCTGARVDITGTAVAYDHFHNNTFISPGKFLSATTSDDYYLVKGHDHAMDTGSHFMFNSFWTFENEEDGLKFRTNFRFKLTYEGDVVDVRANHKCFGAPTILPPPPE